MASFCTAQEEEKDDFFDELPDPIVFLIFNKNITKTSKASKRPSQKHSMRVRNHSRTFSLKLLRSPSNISLDCLNQASARRLLFRETLKDHQTLQNVTISDEKQIGTFSMNRRQIEEFKRGMNSRDWIKKTLVESDKSTPFFRMKVWDVPELKLSGCTMKGVTLVVIERIEEENKKVEESWDWVVKTFDGEGEKEKVFNEAVRKLFEKKRSYISREMNSSFDILQ
ncbi:F-box protein At5g46170 isoform X2 [Coffea arabica]|uniref:F-box protein At5g46170 isoform X2 n=1 Tax=Coffea arabica TaxID=13443 RepID=A0ABM4UUD0_COFAR